MTTQELMQKVLSTQIQCADAPPTEEQLKREYVIQQTRNFLVTLQRHDKTEPFSDEALKIAKRQLKECIDLV